MVRLVERQRLLAKLRQRHRLDLIALESPAGFGRSVLLDQAMADGPVRSADRTFSTGADPTTPSSDTWPPAWSRPAVEADRTGPSTTSTTTPTGRLGP
jgi:hypothetical protein